MASPQEKVAKWALSQVGYVASSGKHNKYAQALDKTSLYNGPKDGYDWCESFADDDYVECFGLELAAKMTNQPLGGCGAGCTQSASYYRAANQWSNTPSIGAQIYFGTRGDEYHTGIVVEYTDSRVRTVEGNTGYSQGYSSGAVLAQWYDRNDPKITGYGVPDWTLVGGESASTNITNTYEATGKVDVDEYVGVQTVTFWQDTLGTPHDGLISGQDAENKAYFPRLTSVEYDGGGSQLVIAIQEFLSGKGFELDVDGYLGPRTIAALQCWLMSLGYDLTGDRIGYLEAHTAGAVQRSLNEKKWN